MSSTGTVGFAWMLSRYSSGRLRMSVVCGAVSAVAITFGWSGVTGPVTEISSPGTPTRRPMKSRTGGLAITLPRITARCESTRIS